MGVETHAVVQFIDSRPDWLAPHLPEGWSPAQVKRQALALLQADAKAGGKISSCTPQSLILALSQAASMGLQLDTSDAYIIPYGREAQLSIGWQGLVKLAKRAGEIRDIEPEIVLSGERCTVQRASDGDRHGIVHEIPLERIEVRPENVVGAYCIITLADGSRTFEYVSRHDIDAARSASKASNSPAWRNWFGEMAKKFCVRRALKRFDLAPDAASALSADDRRHVGEAVVTGRGVSTKRVNQLLGISPEPAPSQKPEESPAPAAEPSPQNSTDAGDSDGPDPLRSARALVQHADVGDSVKDGARRALADLPAESVVEWIEALQHDRVGATHELAEMAKKGDA